MIKLVNGKISSTHWNATNNLTESDIIYCVKNRLFEFETPYYFNLDSIDILLKAFKKMEMPPIGLHVQVDAEYEITNTRVFLDTDNEIQYIVMPIFSNNKWARAMFAMPIGTPLFDITMMLKPFGVELETLFETIKSVDDSIEYLKAVSYPDIR